MPRKDVQKQDDGSVRFDYTRMSGVQHLPFPTRAESWEQ